MGEVASRMQQLRDLGHEITHDWVEAIRAAGGEANPRDATQAQRRQWSDEDLRGIDRAELVWVMVPERPSFGCGFEMGFAVGTGKDIIMSGDWRATVFSAQADARFDSHDEAIEWIGRYSAADDDERALMLVSG